MLQIAKLVKRCLTYYLIWHIIVTEVIAMEEQVNMCAQYLATMMEKGFVSARKHGFPYVAFRYDLINNSGVLEPEFSQMFIKDLNDVFRLVKQNMIDLSRVKIFDVSTEVEVDKSMFNKGE